MKENLVISYNSEWQSERYCIFQHTGIITLEEERQKGYRKFTVALVTHHLLQTGICPQWECSVHNIASFELAKTIGYKEFGKAYIS